jgi:hypothetical protein
MFIYSYSGKGYGQLDRQMKNLSSEIARIRHENDIQRMRTDILQLQMEASSLQRRTSKIINEVRNATRNISYFYLI